MSADRDRLLQDSDLYPPLSALNDLLFCERRCFLHRVEGIWRENAHTAAANFDHRRVHKVKDEDLASGRTARGLWVVSHKLRVVGVCDLVEFPGGTPFPVEYKRGKRRRWDNNEVQLCAQAMGLEEMLGAPIPRGAIFFVKTKRRQEVEFDSELRQKTEEASRSLHAVLARSNAPEPIQHPKCKQCSLYALCLPELVANKNNYTKAAAELFHASVLDA
jgi:CRISPR-associated exonuclease Cas4